MYKNQKSIWGKKCVMCNSKVSILSDKHPWSETDKVEVVECHRCKYTNMITQREANEFYDNEIYKLYNGIYGSILDLGCGSGMISKHLKEQRNITNVYAIDKDAACAEDFIDSEISFINDDISNISKHFNEASIDNIVSRDVIMFIEDSKKFVDDLVKIAKKGIIIVGWYDIEDERMLNKSTPEEIKELFLKHKVRVSLEPLSWYKHGYVIKVRK